MILAVVRFGIAPVMEVKSLERRWAKHRKENGLDRNGKRTETATRQTFADRITLTPR
jgi:hypothetical protein